MRYLIPLLFLLSSCSQSWFCKKCVQGGNILYDTLRDSIAVPGAAADTVFLRDYTLNWDSLRNASPDQWPDSLPCPELPKVMTVKKGKASATITQTKEGLDVKVKSDPEKVYFKIRVPYRVDVEWPLWKKLLIGLAGLVVGAGIMRLFGR